MTRFHASVRDILEDMHGFLTNTLQKDSLSSISVMHKDKLLVQLFNMQKNYPELQLKFSSNLLDENPSDISETSHYTPSSPVPYVDMNGGSLCKFPAFSQILPEDSSYDVCLIKEKSESRSIAESDDYLSDDAKNRPYVAASELASCDKAGYLDKKKRESIKGWLNPFQRRWCAIKDGVLYYYEKTSDRKQRGSISLAGYEVRVLLEDNNDQKKYNHFFELVCPGKRTYQFSASSEKDLQQWIAVIEKNNNINKYSGKYGQIQSNFISNCSTNFETDYADNVEDIYETVLEEEEDNQLSEYKMQESPLNNEDYSDVDHISPQNQIFDYSEWYVGLWDCNSNDDNELSFVRGDLIRITSKEFDSYAWWIGELDGKIGFVPKSYLMEAYESY